MSASMYTSDSLSWQRLRLPEEIRSIKPLYEQSFPPEERRSASGLLSQGSHSDCHIIKIDHQNILAGFCIYWDFSEFRFVEHLATAVDLRGKGIGQSIIQRLLGLGAEAVLLEVEPPSDTISQRRIAFYQRQGFVLLDTPYRQPSYLPGGTSLAMRIMISQPGLSSGQLKSMIKIVHERVYEVSNGTDPQSD